MSDNNQNGENQTDQGEGKDAANSSEATGLEARMAALEAAHNKANKNARLLAEENKRLKQELDERTKQDAEKSGDATKIREAFQKDIERLSAEKTELATKLRRTVLQSQFNQLASTYFTESAIKTGDVWKLLESELDVEEDEAGNIKPVAKNSALPFDQYLQKFAEERPFLAKNKAKGGSGAQGGDSPPAGQEMTREQFNRMSKAEQQQWAIKNRQGIRKLLAS